MIGRKLKELLESTNTKQVKLAQHMGISPSRLSNYLSDKREPDIDMLAKIACYLQVDLNYFANGSATHEVLYDEDLACEIAGYVLTVPVMKTNETEPHGTLPVSSLFARGAVEEDLLVLEVHEDINKAIRAGNYLIVEKYSASKASIGDAIISGTNYYKLTISNEKQLLISEKNKVVYFEPSKNYYIVRWLFTKTL